LPSPSPIATPGKASAVATTLSLNIEFARMPTLSENSDDAAEP
jgi:hypothetical protein